jgi:hypothetical protein
MPSHIPVSSYRRASSSSAATSAPRRRFRVTRGVEYDHSGKYLAVAPFDYKWRKESQNSKFRIQKDRDYRSSSLG